MSGLRPEKANRNIDVTQQQKILEAAKNPWDQENNIWEQLEFRNTKEGQVGAHSGL